MSRTKNPCTLCGKPGIPGLIKGAGKCQDHWNLGAHGTPLPHDRPMAAHGLKSYRYKGRHGWIMIGATDDADAMSEARRSLDDGRPPRLGLLQAWDGSRYVAKLGEVLRSLADGATISADDYSDAREHPAATGNDRDALLRIMYGSPIRGDRDRVRDLATEIENWKD